MSQCTAFTEGVDMENWTPCRCPVCKGYLPADFPIGRQFQCKKCGKVLETLPNIPEKNRDGTYETEDTDMEHGGRICLVPDVAVKIETQPVSKLRRVRKHRTMHTAYGLGFMRKVMSDRVGLFVTVMGERIEISDSRIALIEPPIELVEVKTK